ncbi:hypothetical protein KQI84_19035 [bacterium]|nr:hypothetical protein [bacterium]
MNFRTLPSEIATWLRQVFKPKNLWIVAPIILAVLVVYISQHFNVLTGLIDRGPLEIIALWLVSISLLTFAGKSAASRDPLAFYLTVLLMIFLFRELDDTTLSLFGRELTVNSKGPVNLLIVAMAVWGVFWHEKIFGTLNRSKVLQVMFFGVLLTYALSQIIARRAFRHILPNEPELHIRFEESAETAAHLFMLCFAIACAKLIPNRSRTKD